MLASPRTMSAAPPAWTRPTSSARTSVSRSRPTIGCALDSLHHHPSIGTGGTRWLTCANPCTTHPNPCRASYRIARRRRNRRVAALAEWPAGEGTPGTLRHTVLKFWSGARQRRIPATAAWGRRGLRSPCGAGTHEGGEEPPAAFVVHVHSQLLGMVLHRQRERMIR
jgi:hypothetical protein